MPGASRCCLAANHPAMTYTDNDLIFCLSSRALSRIHHNEESTAGVRIERTFSLPITTDSWCLESNRTLNLARQCSHRCEIR